MSPDAEIYCAVFARRQQQRQPLFVSLLLLTGERRRFCSLAWAAAYFAFVPPLTHTHKRQTHSARAETAERERYILGGEHWWMRANLHKKHLLPSRAWFFSGIVNVWECIHKFMLCYWYSLSWYFHNLSCQFMMFYIINFCFFISSVSNANYY